MNIQQAAEASGLTADTIRFYEKTGVLPRPPRLANGYRAYTEEHVATLRLAKGLRDLGLPLADVAAVIPVAHDGTCGDLRGALAARLEDALAETRRRINGLARTRDQLTEMLAGLSAMSPDEESVPGLSPCGCVALVTRS